MSSIAVFLVLGGGAAYAAKKIGTNEIKGNSITTGKLKKNAVTASKIKKNSITTAKIKNGAVTGAKVNLGTLGTVPNSSTTDEVQSSKGTVAAGQEATALQYGPLSIVIKCFDSDEPAPDGDLDARAYIVSSTDGTVFSSWEDGAKSIGPGTPEDERQLNHPNWADSNGPFAYDGLEPVSATAAGGQSFNAEFALAAEKDTNTCWYWLTADIIS